MDSSSVLAAAVYATGRKQHAFSSVYEDRTYDESDDIRTILDRTVEQRHTIPVGTPDVFDLVRRMVAVHDEPVATATWLLALPALRRPRARLRQSVRRARRRRAERRRVRALLLPLRRSAAAGDGRLGAR
jgi:asparagine synthetase B (glutamine-hydrolysing)